MSKCQRTLILWHKPREAQTLCCDRFSALESKKLTFSAVRSHKTQRKVPFGIVPVSAFCVVFLGGDGRIL